MTATEQHSRQARGNFKAIIFDLGRVLVDVDLTRGIFRYLKQTAPDEDRRLMENLFAQSSFRKYIRGQMSPEEFFSYFKPYLNKALSFEEFKREWCNVFKPMPGIDRLVATLGKRYRLGLLSDIGPLHWAHLKETLPVLNYFPKPLLSFETGCIKPEPRCFQLAAESVAAQPHHCLFIDDRDVNVAGAREFGMSAIQFKDVPQLREQLQALGIL